MNSFNFRRFFSALTCQVLSTRRKWLRSLVVYSLIMFGVSMLYAYLVPLSGVDVKEMVQADSDVASDVNRMLVESIVVPLNFSIFFIILCVSACSMVSHMKDTGSRATYVMWPVSTIEKFLVCLLQNVLLTAILLIVAFCAADLLRVCADLLTGRNVVFGIPIFFNMFFDYGDQPWQIIIFSLLINIYIHSLYLLGGNLFRRHPFMLTSLFLVIEGFAVVLICKNVTFLNYFHELLDADKTGYSVVKPEIYVFIGLLSVLIVFHYWFSYRIFSRMQVINNKLLNIYTH